MSVVLFSASDRAQAATRLAKVAASSEISQTKPDAVGFSAQRLGKLDAGRQSLVGNKKLAGHALARRGKIVQAKSDGYADVASRMQNDTVVRIYSMTKPITGIARMMLYGEGKWKPSDPISRYIPDFRDLARPRRDGLIRPMTCYSSAWYSVG